MKERIEEMLEKYTSKRAYRESRVEKEKRTLERFTKKYENGECEFETLFNQQKNYAIQQDLLIQLVEIENDLREILKGGN